MQPAVVKEQKGEWNDVEYSDDESDGNPMGNMIKMGSILRSVTNVGSAVTGSVTDFAGTMNKKL